jgi:hypothetical protein
MSNKAKSLRETLKPLATWDSEPALRFEEIAPVLQNQIPGFARLGFFDELALDFSLVLRSAMSLQLLAESLLLLGIVAFVVIPPHSVVRVAAAAQVVEHGQNVVERTSSNMGEVVLTTEIPYRHIKSTGSLATNKLSSREARVTGGMPALRVENFVPIELHSENTLIVSVPSQEALVAPILGSPTNLQNTIRPSASLRSELYQSEEPSGITFGIHSQFASIPAENGISGKAVRDLEYSVGYNFNGYHQVALTYSKQTFRQITAVAHSILVINFVTGKSYVVQTYTYSASDNSFDVPGISYTFHAKDFKLAGIEPFVSAFGSWTSAGFLWRASGGLEWQPVDHITIVGSYAREQLSSTAYSSLQSNRAYLNLGLDYRW